MIGDISSVIGDSHPCLHVNGKKWKGEKVMFTIAGIATVGKFAKWDN